MCTKVKICLDKKNGIYEWDINVAGKTNGWHQKYKGIDDMREAIGRNARSAKVLPKEENVRVVWKIKVRSGTLTKKEEEQLDEWINWLKSVGIWAFWTYKPRDLILVDE